MQLALDLEGERLEVVRRAGPHLLSVRLPSPGFGKGGEPPAALGIRLYGPALVFFAPSFLLFVR